MTMEAAIEVASNLRHNDYREVTEGHGHCPLFHIPMSAFVGDTYYFQAPNGKAAAIGGVNTNGQIWMLCTPIVEQYPMAFVRDCKRMIESREEKLLWNIVDKRNTAHLKLLKFLGFKFLRELKHGPNQLTFIEFCRVRTSINSDGRNAGCRPDNAAPRARPSSRSPQQS